MGLYDEDLKKSLLKLKECFVEVNDIADDICEEDVELFNDKYPFAKSFDELTVEVCEWVKNMED